MIDSDSVPCDVRERERETVRVAREDDRVLLGPRLRGCAIERWLGACLVSKWVPATTRIGKSFEVCDAGAHGRQQIL